MMGSKRFKPAKTDDVSGFVLQYLRRMKPKSVSELGNYKEGDIKKVKSNEDENGDLDEDLKLPEDLARGGKFGVGDMGHEENLLLEKGKRKYKAGGITFDWVQLDSSVPQDLICEECEKAYSICKCDACDQVFCAKCADLTHPRDHIRQMIHKHELYDRIRPIMIGDTSRMQPEAKFLLSTEITFEEDLMKVKDITKPNSLTFNPQYSDIRPVSKVLDFPIFQVYEYVIFTDPASGEPAYGQIICEWNYRHGQAAPAIKRGENARVWYVIEMKELLSQISDIAAIVKPINSPPPEISFPTIEGAVNIHYRYEYYKAVEIKRKLAEAEAIKRFGPRNHFVIEVDIPLGTAPDQISNIQYQYDDSLSIASNLSNDVDDYSVSRNLPAIKNKVTTSPTNRKNDAVNNNPGHINVPSIAAQRTYSHALGYSAAPGQAGFEGYTKRALNILVLPGNELLRPHERADLLHKAKIAGMTNVIEKCFNILFHKLIDIAFTMWKTNMEHIKARQRHFMTVKIQSCFRRWLCRNILEDLQSDWEAELRKRWRRLHKQFHYCTRETLYSKTMNHKLYFPTQMIANKYAAFLRKIVLRVMKFLDRKRLKLLRSYVRHWKLSVEEFNEGDLKCGHFNHDTVDVDALEGQEDHPISVEEQQQQAETQFRHFLSALHPVVTKTKGSKGYRRHVDLDPDAAIQLPLAIHRNMPPEVSSLDELSLLSSVEARLNFRPKSKDSNVDSNASQVNANQTYLPPSHPRQGMSSLPALRAIYLPKTAITRLEVTRKDRLSHCGFKANMEGPTDDSCWVIPGRLAMGKLPWGSAHKRTHVSASASLLLAGLDTFVSLLKASEEIECEQRLGISPVADTMQHSFASAAFVANQVVIENEEVVREQTEVLEKIPNYREGDRRYAQAHREILRAKARLSLADDTIRKYKQQLKKLPSSFAHTRYPLESEVNPSMNELLSILWDLERRLAEGRCLYVYSREGHGRVGLICACLLGRLYGINPHEALYRVQASHDSAKCEEGRKVPVSCPHLQIQRNLVTEVLVATNRVFEGVSWRSLSDPETSTAEVHRTKRGEIEGLEALILTDPAQVKPKRIESFDYDIARDTVVASPDRLKRGNDAIPLYELYDPAVVGQNMNVVREIDMKRQPPAVSTKLPLIRTAREAI